MAGLNSNSFSHTDLNVKETEDLLGVQTRTKRRDLARLCLFDLSFANNRNATVRPRFDFTDEGRVH